MNKKRPGRSRDLGGEGLGDVLGEVGERVGAGEPEGMAPAKVQGRAAQAADDAAA